MPFGSTPSVHRSLRRWLGELLYATDEGWRVHLENRFRSDDDAKRPVAWIEMPTPPRTRFARVGYPVTGSVEREATFIATMLPEAGGRLPQESTFAATTLAEYLQVAVDVGLVVEDPDDENGRRLSMPGQIPLYQYDDVPVTGNDRGGPTDPYGHADVMDCSARAIPDPEDDLLYAVVLSLRLRWWSSGAVLVGPLATHIPATFHGSGDMDDDGEDFPDETP